MLNVLAVAILFLFYVFSCVLAYNFYLCLGWRNAAESPLVAVWPAVLLFWFVAGWPVMFFMWVCKSTAKNTKRVKCRCRQKSEIVK